jgi:hypothetical protein
MRKLHAVGTTVLTAGALLVGTVGMATPAMAAGRHVIAHVDSPNKPAGNGATTLGDISKTASNRLVITDAYVNDTCATDGDGDGYGAWGRVHVVYASGAHGYGTWHKDTGGCDGIPGKQDWGTFTGSGTIVKAGFQACVYDGSTRIKCASSFTSY